MVMASRFRQLFEHPNFFQKKILKMFLPHHQTPTYLTGHDEGVVLFLGQMSSLSARGLTCWIHAPHMGTLPSASLRTPHTRGSHAHVRACGSQPNPHPTYGGLHPPIILRCGPKKFDSTTVLICTHTRTRSATMGCRAGHFLSPELAWLAP